MRTTNLNRLQSPATPVGGAARRGRARASFLKGRRGIVAVLAMMFVVLFGSLTVAMAISSRGNLRTASTHLYITRAISSAETGMQIAEARLREAASRFVVAKGTVDAGFGQRLWSGATSEDDGAINVLSPPSGHDEYTEPTGLAQALVNLHAADVNTVMFSGSVTEPEIVAAPAGTDETVYGADNWVITAPVAIDVDAAEEGAHAAAYQITYAPLANGTDIRVMVTGYASVGGDESTTTSTYGYSFDPATHASRPLTRTITKDFRLSKRHSHAILSPSRIMIGKNVQVTGNIGARYVDTEYENGHPMVVRSDFRGIDATLDKKLDDLEAGIVSYDADGDNRLRTRHPVESEGLPSSSEDYDGDGAGDDAFADATGDGYVDDFDVFLNQYDDDSDGRVVLSTALTEGTPAEGKDPEFTADDGLALLIDSAVPDRNRNGVSGFDDANANSRWDPGETILDHDAKNGTYPDQVLGWRDGYLDKRDQYAKVRGRLAFKVAKDTWEDDQGDYHQYVNGAIVPKRGQSPVQFSASDQALPDISADSFASTQTPLQEAADGGSFASQVASQLGINEGELAAYVETSTDENDVRYFSASMDDATVYSMTGMHLWEKMPFNSPSYTDIYIRPRYENMTFKDLVIPRGTNALFVNCTFVGVTYIQSETDNNHVNWTLYGKMVLNESGTPEYVTDPLDKSDFLRYETGNVADGPANYDDFPDPPVVDSETKTGDERNTKLYSNNIRFHNCLFVGSITSDVPSVYTHVRNKLQFTGGTRFTQTHPTEPDNEALNPEDDDLDEIAKSSLLAPNYSVDIGSFNSPTDTFEGGPTPQNVRMQGTIVAGVLDARGTTSIDGSLILTFAPVLGEGPLQQNGEPVGSPAGFNTTLGYFGEEDGDGEAIDPETLTVHDGQRIVGWDLNGDGIPDLNHDDTPTEEQLENGATPIPFYGYGRITLNWNPDLPMPDGILLPLTVTPLSETYAEGKR